MQDLEKIQAQWPGWRVVRKLGQGGFGAVYEIERDVLGETEKAALKTISIPQNDDDIEELKVEGYDDATITKRFHSYLENIVKEYSTMAKLKGHPNVVYCDDIKYIQHDDGFGWDIFIRMELLTPIMQCLDKIDNEESAIDLGIAISNALAACANHNIIHRDIKPQNIFMSSDGTFKLGDFGIAKTVEHVSSGTKIGTMRYIAPEVYHGKPYGAAADQYSLGIVLYWLLNERRIPFLPKNANASQEENARVRRLMGEQIPPPAHGSRELQAIILKACSYDPALRFPSAEAMMNALQAVKIGNVVGSKGAAVLPAAKVFPDETVVLDNAPQNAAMQNAAASYYPNPAGGDDEGTVVLDQTPQPVQGNRAPVQPENTAPDKKEAGKKSKVPLVLLIILGALLLAAAAYLLIHFLGGRGGTDHTEALSSSETEASQDTSADETTSATEDTTAEPESTKEASAVMSYADYAAAELESEVTIEGYFQAAQSWWNDSATIYLQDEDGAYFLYGAACSEEDYNKLVPGVKLLVKGYKSEWGGEIEITDATFEIIDDGDTFIAEAKDVTAEIAKDSLINYQNQLVKFSGMTVEAYDESGAAFVYKDAEAKSDDLYFKVSKDGATYEFCVEFYLCGNDTEVYKAVEALNVGDVIDAEGFLYWYNGLNPHVTRVTVVSSAPAPSDDGIMSYDEFMEAELDTEVTVDAYIQAIQEWEENAVTLYAQDPDGGGYYIPDMICYEKDAEKLAPGMKIRVTGNKAAPYKEVQIQQARYTIIDDAEPYFAEPVDVTEYLGTDDLIRYQNQVVAVKGLTIIPRGEDGGVYTYYYDNSGTDGDDMFFDSTLGDLVVNLKVESRVSSNTEVYTTVKELKVGDVIDIEGIIFWWKQPYFMVTEVKTAD